MKVDLKPFEYLLADDNTMGYQMRYPFGWIIIMDIIIQSGTLISHLINSLGPQRAIKPSTIPSIWISISIQSNL